MYWERPLSRGGLYDAVRHPVAFSRHAWFGLLHHAEHQTIDELLQEAEAKGASDLHLTAGEPPSLRVNGDLVRTEREKLDAPGVMALVEKLMSDGQKAAFKENLECDFAAELKGIGRYRVNVFQQQRGPGAVMRSIPTRSRPWSSSGSAHLQELCQKDAGRARHRATLGQVARSPRWCARSRDLGRAILTSRTRSS